MFQSSLCPMHSFRGKPSDPYALSMNAGQKEAPSPTDRGSFEVQLVEFFKLEPIKSNSAQMKMHQNREVYISF